MQKVFDSNLGLTAVLILINTYVLL